MIRRTLAVAGAVALAAGFTSVPGPASADPGGTIQQAEVVVNEVAAELNILGGFTGGFVELKNIGDLAQDISGWEITACTTSTPFSVVVPANTPDLDPGEFYLVGDPNFNGTGANLPDRFFPSGSEILQIEGGARVEDNASPRVLKDQMGWAEDGTLNVSCADPSSIVAVEPTDEQSINLGSPWSLASPTPGT